MTNLEKIESEIISKLDEADKILNSDEFNILSESIIEYIDDIGRDKYFKKNNNNV